MKVFGLGFSQRNINRNFMPPILHIPSLDLVVLWGDNHCGYARVFQRSSWLKQFGLFKAVGGQDRNSDAAEIIACHFMLSFMNLGRSKISVRFLNRAAQAIRR